MVESQTFIFGSSENLKTVESESLFMGNGAYLVVS